MKSEFVGARFFPTASHGLYTVATVTLSSGGIALLSSCIVSRHLYYFFVQVILNKVVGPNVNVTFGLLFYPCALVMQGFSSSYLPVIGQKVYQKKRKEINVLI